MKKVLIFLFCLFVGVVVVNAETQALDLKDTVIASGFTLAEDEDKYVENDKQITVYLFRSPSCKHCHSAIEFFNSLVGEYGDKFRMRSYDCDTNASNRVLKDEITSFLEIDAPNVPLIIIGKNSFYGFSDKTKDKIKKAIDNEYNANVKYDVIEEMDKGKNVSKTPKYIIGGIVILGIIVGVILLAKKS